MMDYFTIEMPDGRRLGPGSVMRAGPPLRSARQAHAWKRRGAGTSTRPTVRIVIGIDDPRFSTALGCGRRVHDERCRSVLEALERTEAPGPARPVDMREVAAGAWPVEMDRLTELVHDITRRQNRHGYSVGLLRHWALQLLLDTSEAAGRALTSRQGWPMTWYSATATKPGKSAGRGWKKHQVALLTWRVKHGRWPQPKLRLAGWWANRTGDPKVPGRTEEKMLRQGSR